ncbi:unnamed protein product [Didymodactylos carnosus]|uniref:TIR domain-containing protein n=1 Tax=Didymodactylos carnosus TaxID=1234261 RepID=A0A814MFN5_9BILA|nr:unnamed protein product [Didymodactylos carnosus]CAF3844034.1 unnamed protein product [Didymodactylos carnosus]
MQSLLEIVEFELYSNELLFNRETFITYLELFNSSLMIEYLKDQLDNEQLVELCGKVIWIIILITTEASRLSSLEKNDLKNSTVLFESIMNHITTHIGKENASFQTQSLNVTSLELITKVKEYETNKLLGLLWNLVDKTVLIPFFVDIGYPKAFLQWMAMSTSKRKYTRSLMPSVYNIARHYQGAQALRDQKAGDHLAMYKKQVIEKYGNKIDATVTAKINLYQSMTTALMLEPEEIKKDEKTTNNILDTILDLTIEASQSATLRTNTLLHISELLVVLTKIFVNDDVVDYILKYAQVKNHILSQSRVQFFCDLLIRTKIDNQNNSLLQLTCITLFNILWSISFNDKYQTEMKQNELFVSAIKTTAENENNDELFAQNSFQKHLSSIKKAADGILFNLNLETVSKLPTTHSTNANPSIFISYSHGDKVFCKNLIDVLQPSSKQTHFWVDFLNINSAVVHSDDLWEQIAEAIEKADAIILIISKNYYDSKSCRQELSYAKDMQKKRIIPIYMQKEYKPTGWLGIRIAGLAYIDFSKKAFDIAVKELSEILNKSTEIIPKLQQALTLVDSDPKHTTSIDSNSSIALEKPTTTWTLDDINLWFEKNRISTELRMLFDFQDGAELLTYASDLKSNLEREEKNTRLHFEKKHNEPLSTLQFNRFKRALYHLIDVQNLAQKNDLSNPPISLICSMM